MSNTGEFYDHTTFPVTRSTATSAGMRQELDLVEAGFNKLPPMSGNAMRLVKVGSGGADMTVSSIYEDASNRVLIGTSTARTVFGAARGLQVEAASAQASLTLVRTSADTAGAFLGLGKSRGGVTAVQAGDVLGNITFVGADGTDFETPGATIQAVVDGTPGANDMPTRLEFYTTADGSATGSLRLTLNSAGLVLVGSGVATGDAKIQVTNGVRFGGTTSTDVNTLDFYAEGTFTPTAIGSTTAGAGTYTAQEGTYTRIGNRVFFSIHLAWTAHTGTGNLRLGTLPYTAGGAGPVSPPCAVWSTDLTFAAQLTAMVVNGTQQVYVRSISTGAAFTEVALDTAASIYISGHYNV